MSLYSINTMTVVIYNLQYSRQQVMYGMVYNYDNNGNLNVGCVDEKYYNEFGFSSEGFLNFEKGRYYLIKDEIQKGLQKIENDY